ncbi:MAG: PRC-barrel domain-containing protein [Actinomycetota bacterium]|nr:PRC-barrel domain-containing protein [Actinomycetota bacterium]
MSQGPAETYKDYTVYDQHYEKVGKVDDLFVDENDQPEYIGVKMGLLGTKSTLIPIELVRVNDRRKLVEVAADEETIKQAPTFNDDSDITPEYEHGVYGYFGLQSPEASQARSGYGGYYASDPYPDEELQRSVDTEYGERTESSTPSSQTASSGGTGGTNLDVPLAGTGRSGSSTDLTGTGEAQRPEEGQRSDVEAQGDRNVRVYKRTRSGRG